MRLRIAISLLEGRYYESSLRLGELSCVLRCDRQRQLMLFCSRGELLMFRFSADAVGTGLFYKFGSLHILVFKAMSPVFFSVNAGD